MNYILFILMLIPACGHMHSASMPKDPVQNQKKEEDRFPKNGLESQPFQSIRQKTQEESWHREQKRDPIYYSFGDKK